MKVVLIVAFITTCLSSAFASPDGNTMLHDCSVAIANDDGQKPTSPEGEFAVLHCMDYVDGYLDAFEIVRNMPNCQDKKTCCWPEDVKTMQVIRVFVKYMWAHPEELHWHAGVLLISALHESFPCKKENETKK